MAQLATGVLILMMILITVEVCLRLFGRSIRIADEFSGYMMVALSFWAAAEVVRVQGHINITVLTELLPAKLQSVLNGLNYVAAFVLVTMLLWAAWRLTLSSFRTGALTMGVYQIPRYVPQVVIPVGLFVLLLQIANQIVRLLRKRRGG